MKIQLVKDVSKQGVSSYYTTIDGDYVAGSIATNIIEARMVYDNIKCKNSEARTEILIEEEI